MTVYTLQLETTKSSCFQENSNNTVTYGNEAPGKGSGEDGVKEE